jgi:hypothetical protein
LTDAQCGAFGAADPGSQARRPASQDGYARGDEHDLLSPAHGLSLAVSAARPVSSAFDGLRIFRKFQHDGGWESIWEELHMALREALDREASPTAAIIDSQSLKAAEKGSREPE